MKTKARLILSTLITLMLLVSFTGVALAFDSGTKPGGTGADTITWTGHGGDKDFEEVCPSGDTLPDGIDPYNYLHWVLTTDGGSVTGSPVLHLGGTGSGDYSPFKVSGGMFHFFTPYFEFDGLSAYADINIYETGNGAWNLNISHGCVSDPGYEELTVSKTAETSFTREHFWSIAKSVDTTDLDLYIPGQGDGKPSTGSAEWTVVVSYDGFKDSAWNVSGEITIENTGTLDAIITDVSDSLFPVECGVTFSYTLVVGDTLTCTYSHGYDSQPEAGINEATVTTEVDTYSDSAAFDWDVPTEELNKTVEIVDSVQGKLGKVTAPLGDEFTYSKEFAWGDYGDGACGDHTYYNTAQVIGDEVVVLDEATASLNVHVQCHVFQTAYGKGTTPTCFIPTFDNWGWTNSILTKPTIQTWNLWAGAAQCKTYKGTLVGSVTVNYKANGFVVVTWNVGDPYIISETHVYAGITKFPKIGNKFTVAPGQYTNVGPFSGPIYVITHAKVGLPDPNFP